MLLFVFKQNCKQTTGGGSSFISCCPQTLPAFLKDEQIVKHTLQNSMQRSEGIWVRQWVRWDNIPVSLAIKYILMLCGPILEKLQRFC